PPPPTPRRRARTPNLRARTAPRPRPADDDPDPVRRGGGAQPTAAPESPTAPRVPVATGRRSRAQENARAAAPRRGRRRRRGPDEDPARLPAAAPARDTPECRRIREPSWPAAERPA